MAESKALERRLLGAIDEQHRQAVGEAQRHYAVVGVKF